MAAFKVGHAFSKLVENIQNESLEKSVGHKPSAVDSELCLALLKGQFIENPKWVTTLKQVLENRIKTFLISNCSDSQTEREVLLSRTQKFVQVFAAKHGFQFMLVDFWSGLKKRAELSPHDFELILAEFERCVGQSGDAKFVGSLAPNAVVIHTDAYGDWLMPAKFSPKHFKWMMEAAGSLGGDIKEMTDWFALDDESNPPTFELRSVSEMYKLYRSVNPSSPPDGVNEAQALWQTNQNNMSLVLSSAAQELARKGLISKENYLKYRQSVFHQMVDRVLSLKQPQERCLIFSRKFDRINPKDDIAESLLDFELGTFSPSGLKKSEKLIKEVKHRIPAKMIRRKTLPWNKTGITSSDRTHQHYLSYLQTQSYLDLTRRISASDYHQKQMLNYFRSEPLKELFLECASQTLHVRSLVANALSRDGILEWVFDTIVENKPMLLVPGELSPEDDWLDWNDNSTAFKSTRLSQSRSTGNKMTSTPAFSRQGTMKLSRSNTKDKLKLQREDPPNEEEQAVYDAENVHGNDSYSDKTTEHTSSQAGPSNPAVENKWPDLKEIRETVVDFADFDPTGEQLLFDRSQEYAPFFLVGSAYTGKSTMAATMIKYANTYLPEYNVIFRFCGATEKSRTFFNVLRSVTHNLARLSKEDFTEPRNLQACIKQFVSLCDQANFAGHIKLNRPIIIILDQLEDLDCEDAELAMSLKWLPHKFGDNVLFVITANKWNVPLITAARNVTKESWRFFELPDRLSMGTCQSYLEDAMTRKRKTLSEKQKFVMTRSLRKEPTILFLDSLSSQALNWRKRLQLPLKDSVSLRGMLEVCYIATAQQTLGSAVVRHLCVLLSLSQFGLSELELLDLMSVNDESLQEIYRAQGHPSGDVIRFPLNWWLKLRSYFEPLLSERKVNNVNVIRWLNSSFREVFHQRFLSNRPTVERKVRDLITSYFLGQLPPSSKFEFSTGETKQVTANANRCIYQQQLKMGKDAYNARAMEELAFQFSQTLDMEKINEFYLAFKSLLYTLRGRGVTCLIKDIEHVLSGLNGFGLDNRNLNEVIRLLKDHVHMLQIDPNNFAQVLHVNVHKYNLNADIKEQLANEAFTWFRRSSTLLMMPVNFDRKPSHLANEENNNSTPEQVIPLETEVRNAFLLANGIDSKLLMISNVSSKNKEFNIAQGSIKDVPSNCNVQNLYPFTANLVLAWEGLVWKLLSKPDWSTVEFKPANHKWLTDEDDEEVDRPPPRLIPSAVGQDTFLVQRQDFEVTGHDVDLMGSAGSSPDGSIISAIPKNVIDLFSAKTQDWYRLAGLHLDDLEMDRVLFCVPFFESMHNLVMSFVLDDGHIILLSQEHDWLLREPDQDNDDQVDFDIQDIAGKFPDDERDNDEDVDVDFRENNSGDEFVVKVIDEIPESAEEKEEPLEGHPDNLEEPSLSPIAWKKVTAVKRRVVGIDFSNDPLKKSQLPILYANILVLFTDSSLLLVDLVEAQFMRVRCDYAYDCNIQHGFLLIKMPDLPRACVYSIERQSPVVFVPENEHFLSFVPNRSLLLGQRGTSIRIYSWNQMQPTEEEDTVSKVFELDDPLINPQVAARVLREKLLLFTEAGLALFSLGKLLESEDNSHGPGRGRQLYDSFFSADNSEESNVPDKDICVVAIQCHGKQILVAETNRISVYDYNHNNDALTVSRTVDLLDEEFSRFLHVSINEAHLIGTMNFACLKRRQMCLNIFTAALGKYDTYYVGAQSSFTNIWTTQTTLLMVTGEHSASLFDLITGKQFGSVSIETGKILKDVTSVNLGTDRNVSMLYSDEIRIGTQSKRLFGGSSAYRFLHAFVTKAGASFVISFEERHKVSVLTMTANNQWSQQTLTFKGEIMAASTMTSSKIIFVESNRFHTYDVTSCAIINSVRSEINIEPLAVQVDSQDFRVAYCVTWSEHTLHFYILDSISGNILCKSTLDTAEKAISAEFRSTAKARLLTVVLKSENGKECPILFSTNPAVEDALSKIKMEFPQTAKTAHVICSQFSPLGKESFQSTRPVEFSPNS